MLLLMEYREIESDKIAPEDDTFRISEDPASASLVASLREIGLLNAIVLLAAEPDYRIVCGFRRVEALRQLKAGRIRAGIIKAVDPDFRELYDLALWDNLSHRQLEPLEKARALFKLKNDFGVSDSILIQTYLPRLGLPSHAQTLKAHLLLHESSPDIRRYFKEGRLTQASVERLAQMPAASRGAVVSVMDRMRLSAGSQRKFFPLLEDLAAMADTGPDSILREPRVRAVLDNDRLSPGERGEKVYSILYRLRYPRVSRAEKRFAEKKKSLGLPGAVRIAPDPYFETPGLHVEFDARNAEAFRKRAGELYDASVNPELDSLFEVD